MAYFDDIGIYGDRIAAIQDNGDKITYSQIIEFADEINKLMPKRSLVFSLCRNVIGSMCGYLSFLHNRCVQIG
ncbi:MAG: hypothetical protein ACI4IQ_00315, partial [Eubacterium sp.]